VVLNGAVDMAGDDRGYMRCLEATWCGCLLLSDESNYPESMIQGVDLVAYFSPVMTTTLIYQTPQKRR